MLIWFWRLALSQDTFRRSTMGFYCSCLFICAPSTINISSTFFILLFFFSFYIFFLLKFGLFSSTVFPVFISWRCHFRTHLSHVLQLHADSNTHFICKQYFSSNYSLMLCIPLFVNTPWKTTNAFLSLADSFSRNFIIFSCLLHVKVQQTESGLSLDTCVCMWMCDIETPVFDCVFAPLQFALMILFIFRSLSSFNSFDSVFLLARRYILLMR